VIKERKKCYKLKEKRVVFNNKNNNNNISYLSGPCILDISSLKEMGPMFWNKDPA
jgi:hypothetical protein